jgi:hypothetical protein
VGENISLSSTPFADPGIGPGGSDYIGATHELRIGERAYALRSYDDEPGEISFMRVQDPGDDGWQPIRGGLPYDDPVFGEAARWLLARPEINRIRVFCSSLEHPDESYPYVDPDRLS